MKSYWVQTAQVNFVCLISLWFGGLAKAESALQVGKAPPAITIDGSDGGQVDGTPWKSSSLTGNVWSVIYVDPDQRDDNPILEKALSDADFPISQYRTVGIVNMAATWLPDVLLEAKLKEKQGKYPNAVYVKDETKHLVKSWGVADDAYVFLLFDPQGKLLYQKAGKMDEGEVEEVIGLIRGQGSMSREAESPSSDLQTKPRSP